MGGGIYALTEKMHSAHEAVNEQERAAAGMEMLSYALNLAEEKRKHPGNDIATKLLNSEIDGDRLTPAEYSFFFLLLVNAGGDTTRNLLGGGMLALFNHPDSAPPPAAQPRWITAHRGRGDAALRQPGHLYAPHRDARHRAGRQANQGGRQSRDVLRLGESRREHVSGARQIRRRRARPTNTSHSEAASISVWARTSRGWKSR